MFTSTGESFGFSSAMLSMLETQSTKKYDDIPNEEKHKLLLPSDFNTTLITSNIAQFCQTIKPAMSMSDNFKILFQYYTKIETNYNLVLNIPFFMTIPPTNNRLPQKLDISQTFKLENEQVNLSHTILYNFSRFMMPQQPTQPLIFSNNLVINGYDCSEFETFKQTYIDIFNCSLKSWVKLTIGNNRVSNLIDGINTTANNIKRIIILAFLASKSTDDIIYCFACSILCFNASMIADYANKHDNKLMLEPAMFNIINMDKFTDEQFNEAIAKLRTRPQNILYNVLIDYLNNIIRFKYDSYYPLHKFDEDNRTLLINIISRYSMDTIIATISMINNVKDFTRLTNKITTPTQAKPLGMSDELIKLFESFPRDRFLNFFFDERIHNERLHETQSYYFPLLKHYYYNDPKYSNMLFAKWSNIDYYKPHNKKLKCSEIGIFIEWCLFISNPDYTNKLFEIIFDFPGDAREFVLYNIFDMSNHQLIRFMMGGGMKTKQGNIIIPSFKQPTQTMKDIKQLFNNFINGIIDNGVVLVVPVAQLSQDQKIPNAIRFQVMDIIEAIA